MKEIIDKLEDVIMNTIITEMKELAYWFNSMADVKTNTAEETIRYSTVARKLTECMDILSVMVRSKKNEEK